MMSQTHVLMASALLARPNQKLRASAILIGAIVPDLAIFALFGWSKFAGIPEATVWRDLYWQQPWQTLTALGNSIPLYGALLLLAVIFLRAPRALFRPGTFLLFFALAALIHVLGDLPVHVRDAHRHFWPLTDWKFISPVSYWNPNHHGDVFKYFEFALGVILSLVLMFRFKGFLPRLVLSITILLYLAVPAYFIWMLGGS